MPPERIDRLIGGLKDGPVPVRELDAVRARVFAEVHDRSFRRGPSRRALTVLVTAAGFFLLIGGTTAAAQYASPGDALYPVKRISEEVWLGMQISPQARVRVERAIMNRRYAEADGGAAPGTSEHVEERYADRITATVADIEAVGATADPETVTKEAEEFTRLVEEHVTGLHKARAQLPLPPDDALDDAFVQSVIRAEEAIIRASEEREERFMRLFTEN